MDPVEISDEMQRARADFHRLINGAAWDPYFKTTMSVLEVYHFGTQHFDHHRRQLTL